MTHRLDDYLEQQDRAYEQKHTKEYLEMMDWIAEQEQWLDEFETWLYCACHHELTFADREQGHEVCEECR